MCKHDFLLPDGNELKEECRTPARMASPCTICCPGYWSIRLTLRIKQHNGGRHEHHCWELNRAPGVCATWLPYGGGTLGTESQWLWGGLECTHWASVRHLGGAGREDEISAADTVEAVETAHPQVRMLLSFIHTCCRGWGETLHHGMGDGVKSTTLQHNHRGEFSFTINVEVSQILHTDSQDS